MSRGKLLEQLRQVSRGSQSRAGVFTGPGLLFAWNCGQHRGRAKLERFTGPNYPINRGHEKTQAWALSITVKTMGGAARCHSAHL